MRIAVAVAAIVTVTLAPIPAHAASLVTVPAGTKVLLRFETPVDSNTIKEGTIVKFTVATDVLVGRTIVFRQGTPAQGIVTEVSKPGIFGKNARVRITDIQAEAVDGKPARVAPLDVTPDSVRQTADVSAAGATAITGAILLGPIGLAAGALIRGGNVTLPSGAVGTSSVAEEFQANVP
jgi:hypothetical protein